LTPDRAAEIYRQEFADTRRERLFLSSVSFFTTFAATRAITHAIRAGVGPFHNLTVGGRHFHHLVLGIAGLLGTGYLWLIEVDDVVDPAATRALVAAVLLHPEDPQPHAPRRRYVDSW
jgi:hypothetical protein